jgi:hypothetical protein
VHFVLNLGVAIWFLVVVTQTADSATKHLCDPSVAGDAQTQCDQLFSFGSAVYIVLASLVLLIELCEWPPFIDSSAALPNGLFQDGTLIVTRYVWQLSNEKSNKRQTRRGIEDAFKLEAARARYTALASSHELTPMGSPMYDDHSYTEYDPYKEASLPPPIPPVQSPQRFRTFMDQGRPAAPLEDGYGGGTWTHEEISEEEKARLQKQEREQGIDVEAQSPPIDEAEMAKRRSEIKIVGGPTTSYASEVDDLPRYPSPRIEPRL